MLESNRPSMELGLTVVRRKHDGSAVARVWAQMTDGTRGTLYRQEWPSGRPTPAQLQDVLAKLTDEGNSTVIASIGVQGVLEV